MGGLSAARSSSDGPSRHTAETVVGSSRDLSPARNDRGARLRRHARRASAVRFHYQYPAGGSKALCSIGLRAGAGGPGHLRGRRYPGRVGTAADVCRTDLARFRAEPYSAMGGGSLAAQGLASSPAQLAEGGANAPPSRRCSRRVRDETDAASVLRRFLRQPLSPSWCQHRRL